MPSSTIAVRTPGRQVLVLVVEGVLELGREGNGLLLADTRVSRRHAKLECVADDTLQVTDLDSANGSTIDGATVEAPTALESGQTLVVGDTVIEVLASNPDRGPVNLTTVGATDPSRETSIDIVARTVSDELTPELVGVSDEPGTLTVGFSDIESSTERALAMGDSAWFELLGSHSRLVTAHVEAHRGRIVKNQGDGFMFCFRSARQALLASIGLQRDLERLDSERPNEAVRVRIGLHTGEVLVDDDGDLFGKHVVVAARVASVAGGGEIAVSSLLKQIAEPRGDIAFSAPLTVVLKGIDGAQEIHQVDWRSSSVTATH